MKCPALQRSLAILCLLAFGLGQTVFVPLGVRCTDATGETRIEIACIKSDEGSCRTSGLEVGAQPEGQSRETELPSPVPCEDEPLGLQESPARLAPTDAPSGPVHGTVFVAARCEPRPLNDVQPARSWRPNVDREHPPDSLARLRTIIMLV